MPESRFPIEFPKCPNCGSTETVTELAVQEIEKRTGVKRGGPFASFEKVLAPLVAPQKVTGVTLPMLLCHWDVCAGCGQRRCTKAEIIDAPITMAQPPGGRQGRPPGFPPGAHGPFGFG
jgi:hypothetical protein